MSDQKLAQSEVIVLAEHYTEAARKHIEDYRKFEDTLRVPDHWGYLDENKQVVRCRMSDLLERYDGRDPLGQGGMGRHVDQDVVRGKFTVSTVFLALDHGFGGEPMWFETMVFGGLYDQEMWRYSTYAQAWVGHQQVLAMVQDWARWRGYSQSHLRKIRREYRARGWTGALWA